LILTFSLAASLIAFGWATNRTSRQELDASGALPKTNAPYWLAMLSAGVFGTVVGDICEHVMGEGVAAVVLSLVLLAVLMTGRKRAGDQIGVYWVTVAIARTAGTAIGDWFAENKILNIGLPLCTLFSGVAFVAVLVFWRNRRAANSDFVEVLPNET
jgi:uncharacterized membrane-anchored protein